MFLYTIVLSISSINCTEKNNSLVTNQAALFVFGDSLFDAGNYKYINNNSAFQSNFFPYGQTTFKFPTGRVSDGRLITDFIGFKVGQMGCCGSGPFRGINTCGGRMGQSYELCENVNDYLFFDSSHLTEKAHQQIAELVWSGPPNVTRPYNLKALFELN
ncbi:hypothetical protein F2Q68_00006878 [Brassica cretica]|uniref:Uncharacterized protein n=1 Tax=Brassica cretica TaxID=69181 RepID=A0A8S9JGA6_BRACR|nr:hypothetical protein F2Q68_00006878 [Brassica cretica]